MFKNVKIFGKVVTIMGGPMLPNFVQQFLNNCWFLRSLNQNLCSSFPTRDLIFSKIFNFRGGGRIMSCRLVIVGKKTSKSLHKAKNL